MRWCLVKKNRLNREKRASYLLVAPSLILILVIAIFPVFRSFYISLFDLKLNDPTKSEIHLHNSMNLNTYLEYYPFLINDVNQAINKSDGELQGQLKTIKKQLLSLDKNVKQDAGPAYKKVDDLLNNFKTPSSDLSMVEISNDTAKQFKKTIKTINDDLKSLKALPNSKDINGLASGLKGAVIEPNFIGLKHYTQEFQNPRMWASLWNTVIFTAISVAIEFVLGLGIALLINKAFFGRGLIRASVLIPWAIPTAVSAMMWKFLYDGQSGIVAKFLADIGLFNSMTNLLTSKVGAMFSVILADVWKTTPYIALLLLGGLQVIPKSLYEAAAIDGASKWKQFIHITLPMLKLSILVALLFRTLDAFRVFDLVYVLTGGGPANSTETISIMAYKVMFSQTNFGDGAALSVIVFICVAIISMIFVKILGSDLLPEGTKK
jgi:multiple sugar transport system permease protein